MGLKFLIASVVLAALFSGCAKPKYVNETAHDKSQNAGQEAATGVCETIFSTSGLCLFWYWEVKPTAEAQGSLIFKTYRFNHLDQTPVEVDLAQVPQVILWMPGMGHGSTPTQTTRMDLGTYRVSQVYFVMPGEWEIRFQVKNGSEVVDAAQVSLNF